MTTQRPGRPTLAAIARAAGTSIPTVSKVLRGGTDVSDATRSRVIQVATELGYARRQRDSSRVSTAQPPALVDLVVSNVEGSWANRVLAGVENAATEAGCDVVITIARPDRDWVDRLLRRPSAGAVIVLVDPTRRQLDALRAGGVPIVLIDPMSTPPASVASVGVTNWEGARSAGEHLLAAGHRRFGVIGGDPAHLYSLARIDGFRSALALAQSGTPSLEIAQGDWSRESGRVAALQLLEADPDCTAIFACSDLMALGAYDAARQLGRRIPDDLAVVGFDDVPEAEWVTPLLTTVQQPIAEMGAAALRMLLRLSADRGAPGSSAPREELSTRLIVRESSVPIASAE